MAASHAAEVIEIISLLPLRMKLAECGGNPAPAGRVTKVGDMVGKTILLVEDNPVELTQRAFLVDGRLGLYWLLLNETPP